MTQRRPNSATEFIQSASHQSRSVDHFFAHSLEMVLRWPSRLCPVLTRVFDPDLPVDFSPVNRQLIIETAGEMNMNDEGFACDQSRARFLLSQGFRVFRLHLCD